MVTSKKNLDLVWKKLGEICEIIMGQSPPSDTYNNKQEGLPFFQGKAELFLAVLKAIVNFRHHGVVGQLSRQCLAGLAQGVYIAVA